MAEEPDPATTPKTRTGPIGFYRACELGSLAIALVLAVAVLLVLFLPAGSRRRVSKKRVACRDRLKEIMGGCRAYALARDGAFPDDLDQLVPNYIKNPAAFTCPSDGRTSEERAGEKGSSYVLVRGLRMDMPVEFILAYGRRSNHKGKGYHIAFVGGFVEWRRAEWDIEKRLAIQQEAVRKWRAAGAKKKDITKFFDEMMEEKAK
jgi:hypothetical protein